MVNREVQFFYRINLAFNVIKKVFHHFFSGDLTKLLLAHILNSSCLESHKSLKVIFISQLSGQNILCLNCAYTLSIFRSTNSIFKILFMNISFQIGSRGKPKNRARIAQHCAWKP